MMAELYAGLEWKPWDEPSANPRTLLGIHDDNLAPLLSPLGFAGEEPLKALDVAKALIRVGACLYPCPFLFFQGCPWLVFLLRECA